LKFKRQSREEGAGHKVYTINKRKSEGMELYLEYFLAL